MVKVRIQKLILTQEISKHFSKHGVSETDVETVIYSDCLIAEGHSGMKILTGRVGKRIISVVTKMWSNKAKVITARDASDNERKRYYEFEKQIKTNP